MTRSIVQLVPSAPPIIGGVGDFALEVARAMRTERGIDSIFVICNVDWNGPDSIDGFRMVQLSAYGFSENGAPFWLLQALRCWKDRDPTRKVVIFFHELFALSPPWKRGFWLSPLQRVCARQMAALADASVTSTQQYMRTLRGWDPHRANAYACLAIPSTVGEPQTLLAIEHRRRRMVVFGSASIRGRAYSRTRPTFEEVCDLLNVKEIVDVGDGSPRGLENLTAGKVIRLGALAASKLGEVLADSQFGYLDYYAGYLAKSSIFAAYCAHGLVPVLPSDNHSEADGILAGRQFWYPALGPPSIHLISVEARGWYLQHSIEAHALLLSFAILGT